MALITLTFLCGHTRQMSGNETEVRCACGETQVTRIEAPAPHFTGHATGPCATFQDLPAEPVTLGERHG